MHSELSDEALIESFREQSESPRRNEWINELFRRHRSRVALWCLRMTSDREVALDLTQEILARAYEKLESFRGQSRFTTWLYTITRNHCLNYLKASSGRPPNLGEEALEELESESHLDLFERIDHKREWKEIWNLMRETLTETEVKVMSMHYGYELPLNAVTRLLNLQNQSGAKAFVVSARRKLAPAISRWKARRERLDRSSAGKGGI